MLSPETSQQERGRNEKKLPLVLAWYILTELGSILENAVKMGANVPPWLVKLLKASANIVQTAGDSSVMDGESDGHDNVINGE